MKRKTVAGLIVIVVIALVAVFVGCVEKEEIIRSTPTSTPYKLSTEPPKPIFLYPENKCKIWSWNYKGGWPRDCIARSDSRLKNQGGAGLINVTLVRGSSATFPK